MVSILGISAFYHDSAACLVVDGEIVAAAQEERFTRVKHDHNFPLNAARYCLSEAELNAEQLDYVGFYDKPLLKFDRLLETYLDYAPAGFSSFLKAMPLWMKEKLWMPDLIRTELAKAGGEEDERAAKKLGKKFEWKLLFGDHHESHAASAFYPSPFEEAAILTIDGVGEWATSSIGIGKGNEITLLKELRFPDSLGLLYSAFTYYTGFRVNSGEYKVMGLAPYGEPKYVSLIKDKLLEVRDDGSLKMNHEYFSYSQGLRMTNGAFDKLFGGAPRKPESRITQKEMDLARSIQVITEEVMLKMTKLRPPRNGDEETLHGRRRGVELRGQWPSLARSAVRRYLDSTSGGRCRGRPGNRAGDLASLFGKATAKPGASGHLAIGAANDNAALRQSESAAT